MNNCREVGNVVGSVDKNNTFLFPRPRPSKTPVHSHDVLRRYASDCGAKEPQWITSTNRRKHIVIITQLLNLKKHELDIVAGFMGHDVRMHLIPYLKGVLINALINDMEDCNLVLIMVGTIRASTLNKSFLFSCLLNCVLVFHQYILCSHLVYSEFCAQLLYQMTQSIL